MPKVSITLPDVSQSVFRPVIIDVVKQVMDYTKIASDVPVFFGNESGQFLSAGSGLDNKQDRLMRSESTRRLEIKADETYTEDQQVTDISGRLGNTPVFVDDQLKAWIAPAFTTSTVDMEFAFFTNSKEEARRWRDDVTIRYIQGRYALPHQVTYSFNLPFPTWRLIEELWTKRESVAPYNETIIEYIQKCMTNRLTVISNETGSQQQFSVCERQDRIQGFFGFTNNPDKAEYDQSTGMHVIRFRYSFTYQRPNSVDMQYPIVVHQQLLATKFIDFIDKSPQVDDREVHRSQFLWGMKQFEKDEFMRIMKPKYPYIRIPAIDDFPVNYFFPGTAMFLLILLQQPEGEPLAFNFRDLGDVSMDKDILDFIADGEYQYIGKPGASIFHLDLYRNNEICGHPALSVDADLNVLIIPEIDKRKEYRVRCGLYTDLGMVDRAALDRMMNYPKAFQKILGSINELLRYDSSFQKLGDQKKIEPWQFSRLYEAITGQGTGSIYSGPKSSYGMGGWGTQWVNSNRTFMSDIPESVIRAYRTMRRAKTNMQVQGVVSFNRDRDISLAKSQGIA